MVYERILVAVDGSRIADLALAEGLRLAKDQRARLRVVHVANDPNDAFLIADGVDPDQPWLKTGVASLERAEDAARELALDCETAVLDAAGRRVSQVIIADAGRWSAGLIVMGTHGRHGLDRLILGSVAEEVVRGAASPVLLVHGRGQRA